MSAHNTACKESTKRVACLRAVASAKEQFTRGRIGCYDDIQCLASNSALLCVVLKTCYKEGNADCAVGVMKNTSFIIPTQAHYSHLKANSFDDFQLCFELKGHLKHECN